MLLATWMALLLSPIIMGRMWLSDGHVYPLAIKLSFSSWLISFKWLRSALKLGNRSSKKELHERQTGGKAVVNISVRILLTRYSLNTLLQTMYAPADANALPNVPTKKSMSAMQPSSSASPNPFSPHTPKEIGRAHV